MTGILAYGAYVPKYRLTGSTQNWNWPSERSVANFDEDAVTLAVAAARDCLRDRDTAAVERLYLASTSLPYSEKQSAAVVATAVDLAPALITADIAHSLRGGTTALRLALDAAAAGTARETLVVATDRRLGGPDSEIERNGGDGAAALLVGEGEGVVARVSGWYSLVNEILDVWRPDGEALLRVAPDHFRYDEGYFKAVRAAVEGLEAATGLTPADADAIALAAPDARRHREALRMIGARNSQAPPLLTSAGSTGAALGLMELVAALDRSEPGRRILLINYGDGADAVMLETTEALAAAQRARGGTLAGLIEGMTPLGDYLDYLRWRGLFPAGEAGPPAHGPAPSALYREQDELLRFHGARCRACEMVQFPPQRVCARCQARDSMEAVALAGRAATLFSYSLDYVARTPEAPLVHGVIDFAGGGRAMMMLTDRDVDAIAIGMALRATFRKLRFADGIHNYYWKMTPRRV